MTQGEMDGIINSMVMNLRKLREGQAGVLQSRTDHSNDWPVSFS